MYEIQWLLPAIALFYSCQFFYSWRKRRDHKRFLSQVAVITINNVASSQNGEARPLNVFLPAEYDIRSNRGDSVITVHDGQGEEQWRPISY